MAKVVRCNGLNNWDQCRRGDYFVTDQGVVYRMDCDDPRHCGWAYLGSIEDAARMYGIDLTPDEKKPEPEKSPIDKAIDDMMARRKAKRENPGPGAPGSTSDAEWAKHVKDSNNGEALERALSRNSYPHFTSLSARLAAYRGPEL